MKMNAQRVSEEAEINRAARQDLRYMGLLAECQKYEDAYCRILESLSSSDQDILEGYISLCQELEYRRGQIAAGLPPAMPQR